MEAVKRHISESFRLGAFLTLAGGFMDAYTYVARGKVFATAETGNIVLLGLNLAQRNYGKVIYYLIPILSYACGILAAEQVRMKCSDKKIHWRQWVLLGEMIFIAIISVIPQGELDIAANCMIAFICAMQVESFRKVNGNAYATTMCTGNLRSGMEHVHRFVFQKEKESAKNALQYFGIIGIFICGAILGVLSAQMWGGHAVLICEPFLICAFGMMFLDRKTEE